MLVLDPAKEMSHAAKVMGESFFETILGVINENVIVSDEDLILHEESDINYAYEEVIKCINNIL
jgi:ketosteroid isomerase-like protein